jgi:hypothetical protein
MKGKEGLIDTKARKTGTARLTTKIVAYRYNNELVTSNKF